MSRRIDTAIGIAAPPARVWQVLTDFPRYPEWNPFIRSIQGTAEAGARLRVEIDAAGKRHVFKPLVLQATDGRTLRWLGRVGFPGLFDGEHGFFLEPEGAGTRLRQEESFQGFLVPLLWGEVGPVTRAGFEAMNAALKARAEGA